MKNLLYLFLLFIGIGAASGQQTFTVTGVVTDDNDMPIPGATVFLGDSRKATATNDEGEFTLGQVLPGKYNLVVKMIGYVVSTHAFLLQNADMRFRVKLQEDNVELKAVNISGISLAERRRHLATFTRCFLGASKHAAQCKIINTDIIVFSFDKKRNILSVHADDFLAIENRALGYRMKYLLNSFTYDRSGVAGMLSFDGTVFYEDMEGNPNQKKRWEQQRVDAYLGSSMHFFRSLLNNSLEKNGFVVYEMLNRLALEARQIEKKPIPIKYFKSVKLFKKYTYAVDSNSRGFNLGFFRKDSTELYVVYTPINEPQEFLDGGVVIHNTFGMPQGQKSIIGPLRDTLFINRNGSVSPNGGIQFTGFWMWGKMSWALPADYEIPAGMQLSKIKDDEETPEGEVEGKHLK